jgi:hypothetical protein
MISGRIGAQTPACESGADDHAGISAGGSGPHRRGRLPRQRRLAALIGSTAQPLSGATEPVPWEAGDEPDDDESSLAEEPVDRDLV